MVKKQSAPFQGIAKNLTSHEEFMSNIFNPEMKFKDILDKYWDERSPVYSNVIARHIKEASENWDEVPPTEKSDIMGWICGVMPDMYYPFRTPFPSELAEFLRKRVDTGISVKRKSDTITGCECEITVSKEVLNMITANGKEGVNPDMLRVTYPHSTKLGEAFDDIVQEYKGEEFSDVMKDPKIDNRKIQADIDHGITVRDGSDESMVIGINTDTMSALAKGYGPYALDVLLKNVNHHLNPNKFPEPEKVTNIGLSLTLTPEMRFQVGELAKKTGWTLFFLGAASTITYCLFDSQINEAIENYSKRVGSDHKQHIEFIMESYIQNRDKAVTENSVKITVRKNVVDTINNAGRYDINAQLLHIHKQLEEFMRLEAARPIGSGIASESTGSEYDQKLIRAGVTVSAGPNGSVVINLDKHASTALSLGYCSGVTDVAMEKINKLINPEEWKMPEHDVGIGSSM